MAATTAAPTGGVEPVGARPPTLRQVYVVAVLAVALIAALSAVVTPHDFWWHLAQARDIAAQRSVPATDAFTWTRHGQAFYNQMWLAQLVMLGTYRLGGLPLVVTVHALALSGAVAMLLRACAGAGANIRSSAIVVLGVLPLAFFNWTVRPQAYAVPLFALFLLVLSESRRRPALLGLLPPAMAVWANVHGSFPLGLVLYAATLLAVAGHAGSHRRALARLAVPTALATLLNPRGWEVWSYVMGLLGSASVRGRVTEWEPVGFDHLSGWLYALLLVAVAGAAVQARRRAAPQHVAVALVFVLLGLTARRNTGWAAFAAAPLLAVQLSAWLGEAVETGNRVANLAVVSLLATVALAASPWFRPLLTDGRWGSLTTETPTAAVAALATLPDAPRRLFNDLGYGSYLAFAAPQVHTFADTRFELFPPALLEDYRDLSAGVDVRRITRRYRFDAFLVSRRYQPRLISLLRRDRSWSIAYEDDEAALVVPAQ